MTLYCSAQTVTQVAGTSPSICCCSLLCGIVSKPLYRCVQGSSRHVWQRRGKRYRTLGAPNQPAASPGTGNPTETEAVIARAASHQSASTSQTGAAPKPPVYMALQAFWL